MVIKQDFTLGGGPQCNMQMMYHRIVHLKLHNFINQCHPDKINEKKKEYRWEKVLGIEQVLDSSCHYDQHLPPPCECVKLHDHLLFLMMPPRVPRLSVPVATTSRMTDPTSTHCVWSKCSLIFTALVWLWAAMSTRGLLRPPNVRTMATLAVLIIGNVFNPEHVLPKLQVDSWHLYGHLVPKEEQTNWWLQLTVCLRQPCS